MAASTAFLPAPTGSPELGEDEVHVWLADLERLRGKSFAGILAPDELARSARFHFEKDREHFTAARGVLRLLLGSYLRVPPARLQFEYNEHGKPRLVGGTACPCQLSENRGQAVPVPGSPLEFNLSHSHGLALYGFTYGRKIGVDIEWMGREIAVEELAQRFFAPTEVAELRALLQEFRTKAFFKGWTRKEAFIKAHGKGLSLPLDQFAVSLADNSPALLSMQGDPAVPARWTLRDFATREGYAAAVAVEGRIRELKCWEWQSKEVE